MLTRRGQLPAGFTRLIVTALAVVSVIAAGAVIAQQEPAATSAGGSSTRAEPPSPSPASTAASSDRALLIRGRLIAEAVDPCADYGELAYGVGRPDRQEWYNSLRTDGTEPDYLRYFVACKPGVRWPTADYWCAHSLLSEEAGPGRLWDPLRDGPNGPAGNTSGIPQAYPDTKMASHGPDWRWNGRTQIHWFFDYVMERYGSIWNTPRPCHAGY